MSDERKDKPRLSFPPGDDRVMGYYLAFLVGAALIAIIVIVIVR